MARKSRRSPEGGSDRSREEYIPYRRKEAEPSPEVASSPETRSSSDHVDVAAIEAARAHALDVCTERRKPDEEEEEDENSFFKFLKTTGSYATSLGKGSVQVAVGSVAAFGFLGYKTAKPFARGALVAIDWFARKLDKLGTNLIDKNLPILKYIINPLVSLMDKSAKALGLDKSLAEHLKKNKEDRKKLAEKVYKEYMAAQKKQEQKEDAAKMKANRKQKLVDVLGQDAADALDDELAELDKKDKAKVAEEPKPAEPAKAA